MQPPTECVYVWSFEEKPHALDANKGGFGDDSSISFSLDQHRGYGRGTNATATPFFDVSTSQPKLKILNMSLLGSFGQTDLTMTKEELFVAIWDRMIDALESRHR